MSETLMALLVRVGDGRYALPLDSVVEVSLWVEVMGVPTMPAPVTGYLRFHGLVVPVMDMRIPLASPVREPKLSDHVVIVRRSAGLMALWVDEALGVRSVAPAQALKGAGQPVVVEGLAAFEDGILGIVDLEALLSTRADGQLLAQLRQLGKSLEP